MKLAVPMNLRQQQNAQTRRAILDALAEVIVESSVIGFSVQQVADRAGVTHRTVYNHFPSREALNDAFAEYVEDEFAAAVDGGAPPDASLTLSSIASLPDEAYAGFDRHSRHVHAAVMLMIASQAPAQVTRDRTDRFAQVLERELEHLSPETARLSAAALRMFASSTAWHLMTQHLGLSTDEARRTATWATKTLLRAIANGDYPGMENRDEPTDDR